jgi:hypothetical protein
LSSHSYAGGTGNDLTLFAIPETSTALFGLASLGLILRRRR